MKNREFWADYAKAIGIILVVYGHVERGLIDSKIITQHIFKLIDSIIYTFHIPLFFLISGYFFYFSLNKYGKKNLFIRKLATIAYPYIVWSIIQTSIMAYLSPYINNKTNFSDILTILWAPRDQFWFLYALFLIFCIALIVYSNFSNKKIVSIFAISAIIYILQSHVPSKYGFWHIDYITNNFVYFSAGVVMCKFKLIEKFKNLKISFSCILLFILVQYIFHIILKKNFEDKGVLSLIVAFISIFAIIGISKLIEQTKRIKYLELIGKSSLEIYILHVLATGGIRVILKNIFDIYSPLLHLTLGTFSGIIFPLIFAQLVKKYRIPYIFSMRII